MTLTLRSTMPCEKCLGREACVTVKREFEATVERLHWISEMHHVPLPDIDAVLDCHSYSVPGRKRD